ncbi:MAG: thiolase family protein [Nitrospinaceae bacterium]
MPLSEKPSFIYSALRTPIGKFLGGLASMSAPHLAAVVLKEAVSRTGLSPDRLDEVVLGNVVTAGLGQAPARQAALRAGLSDAVPATLINKVCGSGLKAVMMADQAVRLEQADFVAAGGMESMSRAPFLIPGLRSGRKLGHETVIDALIHDGLWCPISNAHMGTLTEGVPEVRRFGREEQDAYAASSYARARASEKEGRFQEEIVGVTLSGKEGAWTLDRDEPPFADDPDQFSAYPPAFDREQGRITKVNGAKIADGAAILIVGRENPDLSPLARIAGYATHAQAPASFALAPVEAIHKALSQCKLTVEDIDLFEINEAFAAASLAIHDRLGLDPDRVNVNGSAIALGHPIGATGARILVTLIHALAQRNLKRGLASLCIGGGEAIALIVERV